jgi:ubiquinol-cytochrome c reductase cytochrome c1 subunit
MKATILKLSAVIALALPLLANAGGAAVNLDKANVNLHNTDSLQRGAKIYMNYCMGCHSLKYQRYKRTAEDIGLTEDEMKQSLIFTTDKYGDATKIGALMQNNMEAEYAEASFGAAPPDLTLVARARGTDWLYTYLRTFYKDENRPLGANNTTFPNVGMPNVLWELQGWKKATYKTEKNEEGELVEHFAGFETITEGKLNDKEFDAAVLDLVNFLEYVGEPAKLVRGKIGGYVLFFLFLFGILAYALKKEYWRDVH